MKDELRDIAEKIAGNSQEYFLAVVTGNEEDNLRVFTKLTGKTLLVKALPLLVKNLESEFVRDKCIGRHESSRQTRDEEPQ